VASDHLPLIAELTLLPDEERIAESKRQEMEAGI
jgi:hypothetical protein